MRGAREGNTLLSINDLGGKAKVCNFDLFVFNEDICRLNIAMHETFGGKVLACRNDLSREVVYFFLVSIEEVFLNIFLKVTLAIFEE